MIKIVLIIVFQFLIKSASAKTFEFCADNQLFTFSREACPGGVVFKKPLQLSEPCDCINSDLAVYSTCEINSGYPVNACHSFDGEKPDLVYVKLIQPIETRNNDKPKHNLKDYKCKRLRRACMRDVRNTAIARLPQFTHPISREITYNQDHFQLDSANNESKSLNHRRKRDLSEITDPNLRDRIQDTIDFLLELQFGVTGPSNDPKSMSLQMLGRTVKIFNHLAPSLIIEDETLNSIMALFVKKYQILEMPGWSGKLLIDDNVDKVVFEDIMSRLHECASRASDVSQELEFLTVPKICPANVTHVVDKVVRPDGTVERRYLRLGETMPDNRKYIPEVEDLVLGALWKVFDSVYSYCYPYLFSYHNAQAVIYYYTIIGNIFTSPWVIKDFISKDSQGTSMYTSRIEHENLKVLMKNIDFMDEGVHLLSQYKQFFLKPLPNNDEIAPTANANVTDSIKQKRRKRSLSASNLQWNDLEIWDGRAYCLQTFDPLLSPSIDNEYPNIENLCA